MEIRDASIVSGTIIGGIILPLIVWNLYKTKKGSYSNFDISIRQQRASFYILSISLFIISFLILYVTEQPVVFLTGFVFAFFLVLISFIVNFYFKTSLHTATSLFLSISLLKINQVAGVVFLGISGLIGISRVILGRHTIKEVFIGMLIGLGTGTSFLRYPEN